MPMVTGMPLSPDAEVSRASITGISQIPSPGKTDTVLPGSPESGFSSEIVYLSILEQPQSKWRFRYESDKGSHGVLQGRTSISGQKTYPTVKVVNAPENLEVHVKGSLWTTEKIPSLHVHKLCGPACSSDGSCTVKLKEDGTATFQDITIGCVTMKEVREILSQRLQKGANCKLDKKQLKQLVDKRVREMNMNSVRIRFEALYSNPMNGESVHLCSLFSDPVGNQRSTKDGDLKICRMSRISGSALGGDDVFLFCSKVDKKDIQVRFFEPETNWEAFGKFTEADVHHQVAMVCQTPPYHQQGIRNPVKVLLELQRRNGDASESKEFEYIPDDRDDERIRKKRKRTSLCETPDESGGDVNRNYGAHTEDNSYVIQDLNPLQFEPVSNNPLGSSSNPVGFDYGQLDLSWYIAMDEESLEKNIDPNILMENTLGIEDFDQNEVLTNPDADPLVSAAIVPKPVWSIPDDPSTRWKRLQMDSVVVECCDESQLRKFKVAVKSGEVQQAFSKLLISDDSAELGENNGPYSSETDQKNINKEEERIKGEQDVNIPLAKTEETQPRVVSDSAFKKMWHSLCIAVKKGNPFHFLRSFPRLIAFSDESRNTLLHLAVLQEPIRDFIVESLLKVSEETCCPLVNSPNQNHKTPLHIAIESNKPSAVRLMLKYGADPYVTDKQGSSSFHLAVRIKSKECLAELLQKVNYKSPPEALYLDSTDHNGLAPLHYAVRSELVECVTLLCVNGANANVTSKKDGRTPLHHAALQDPKVANILLALKNIDVSVQDYGGNTPLHLACSSRNLHVVRLLMEHGADPSVLNYESIGAMGYGFTEGNAEIKKILSTSRDVTNLEANISLKGSSSASSSSEVPSAGDTMYRMKACDKSHEQQRKSQSYPCSKSFPARSDSGYLSGEFSVLNEEVLKKLSTLLDPPSDLWRSLLMYTGLDVDFERSILKLASSPTKAILTAFLNNGGTVDSLVALFDAAEMHEARNIVMKHAGDCN